MNVPGPWQGIILSIFRRQFSNHQSSQAGHPTDPLPIDAFFKPLLHSETYTCLSQIQKYLDWHPSCYVLIVLLSPTCWMIPFSGLLLSLPCMSCSSSLLPHALPLSFSTRKIYSFYFLFVLIKLPHYFLTINLFLYLNHCNPVYVKISWSIFKMMDILQINLLKRDSTPYTSILYNVSNFEKLNVIGLKNH